MSTVETPKIPLPAGYAIVEKLGAGGYGEVWKATAPGGVEKAIKLVYGHCNEGMAERELKALERVKSVRHPFILSIERYEIVESRLVIVTELAEMSLQDEFLRCQSQGFLGIPRQKLLGYLWDAAEALDFMVERHSLQHLDIKPENLLVVGNHTKVADFGLVKQLANNTLDSMMGGITPLYSAPEIFDDAPSPRSDQYSLAIVYQHLLTDSLPFSGRTPAQLAKQHTLATPNLRTLSEIDQGILAKALAKDPAKRFSDCREFVSALRDGIVIKVDSTQSYNSEGQTNPDQNSDTKAVAESDTASMAAAPPIQACQNDIQGTQAENRTDAKKIPLLNFPNVDPKIIDVETPNLDIGSSSAAVPTLFIGVGGLGIRMLRATCEKASHSELSNEASLAWLAIDTDRDALTANQDRGSASGLSFDDTLHIPLKRPKQYRDASQKLLRWVSRRWLYNIPRSLQTRGFRPLGRIAAVDHSPNILSAIQSRLAAIAQNTNDSESNPSLRVVIMAGMSGGTGSGTLIDIAQGVRSLCREASLDVEVQAVLGSTFEIGGDDSLAAANMFSLLTELSHAQQMGNKGQETPEGAPSLFESTEKPFDDIYAVSVPRQANTQLDALAKYLLMQTNKETSQLVHALRNHSTDNCETFSLRTFDCIDLSVLAREIDESRQQEFINSIVSDWLQECPTEGESLTSSFGQHGNSKFANVVFQQYPKYLPAPVVAEEARDPEADRAIEKANQKRAADVKQIALAFSELLQHVNLPVDAETSVPDSLAGTLSNNILIDFVKVVREEKLSERALVQRLPEILLAYITKSDTRDSESSTAQLSEVALSQSIPGPLECGHKRRTVLLTSNTCDSELLLNSLQQQCETTIAFQAAIDNQLLIREGSELKPLDLGARLAETFPDVNEAASRLHAREDIQWRDLRLKE